MMDERVRGFNSNNGGTLTVKQLIYKLAIVFLVFLLIACSEIDNLVGKYQSVNSICTVNNTILVKTNLILNRDSSFIEIESRFKNWEKEKTQYDTLIGTWSVNGDQLALKYDTLDKKIPLPPSLMNQTYYIDGNYLCHTNNINPWFSSKRGCFEKK